jgi:mRNA-degrading endonuclease RelE of RelBE toxin-antitoxin system
MGRYTVIWSEQAKADVRLLRGFHRSPILAAVVHLSHQAETETRNRKRLRSGDEIPPDYPDPTWEIRVGPHRVLYGVKGETVVIVGVKLKGAQTTGDIL